MAKGLKLHNCLAPVATLCVKGPAWSDSSGRRRQCQYRRRRRRRRRTVLGFWTRHGGRTEQKLVPCRCDRITAAAAAGESGGNASPPRARAARAGASSPAPSSSVTVPLPPAPQKTSPPEFSPRPRHPPRGASEPRAATDRRSPASCHRRRAPDLTRRRAAQRPHCRAPIACLPHSLSSSLPLASRHRGSELRCNPPARAAELPPHHRGG
ncbi:hypothetical protein SETIT_2G032800v2 [Setaria italica]|uniref:Uncharacterized protein n=1 Tax=Setaria italica TaxID=4555 RepID=A0A368PV43_SETIT|nr:hypothetical protein SETIT_2G032800v2 [Setaria italica]